MIFQHSETQSFKNRALQWANGFNVVCYLDSNNFKDPYSKFDTLIAIGAKDELNVNTGNAFEQLTRFRAANPGWITGFFGYDLKNELEQLTSSNVDRLELPDLYFFAPESLIIIKGDKIEITADDPQQVFEHIEKQEYRLTQKNIELNIKSRFTKEEYINTVNQIKQHISRGDIYVTNFCQEFFAENAKIDPLSVFSDLNILSPNPFGGFFKLKDQYILSASPERFLAKRDKKLISQPIKGTSKRGKTPGEDDAFKLQLRNHTKELQENVMIVDLVRNDLTRSAKKGSVYTEELFGIYSFSQLHQMISTIVCDITNDISAIDAIKNTFPMGSMTGAPKINAMKLMELYERTKRGIYSGAMGYFTPDDDFDFNVVIRSLIYNSAEKYLSFQVGGAITYYANAEQEYSECLLKAKAILEVLGNSSIH